MTWSVRTEQWVRARPLIPDTLLALAAAAVVGSYSLEMLQATDATTWVRWTAGGCGAVLLACVALRRVATEAAFLLASLAMAVTVALPNAAVSSAGLGLVDERAILEIPLFFLPTSAVYLLLLYTVAAYRPLATSLVALGVSAVGALLCTARTATAYGALPAGRLTLLLAVLALLAAAAGTWTVGVFQWQRRRRLVVEAVEAAEAAAGEERRRIARDMHDIVAHSLAVIVRQAEGGSSIAARSPDRAAAALATIADTAREALADMRGTLLVLRDGTSREPVQPTLAEIPALVERVRMAGADVRLAEQGADHGMTPGAMVAAYRLVQEALTNSVKHAGSRPTVDVTIAHLPQASVVMVADDGGAAADRPVVPGAGAGLRGIKDRVRAAGGAFEAGPTDAGFTVRAEFPVENRRP